MNIPHKYLINKSLSEQKKKFYEKLASNYKRAYGEYRKKNCNDSFHKKVINWLFSQNEETRMILCSVENQKYTNTFHDAYTYCTHYSNEVKFRIYDEEGGDVEKYRFDVTDKDYNNMKKGYSDFGVKEKKSEFDKIQNSFLNNIVFYQSESPLNDINNYSNYFTLKPDFLRNEEIFKNDCNELSYNNFLVNPIMTRKEVQNKINILSFELPNWISNNNNENLNINCNYYNEDIYKRNNNKFFYLSQYFLALIEQALSIRYLLYYENKNMEEIISSTYLYDLFNKKKLILSFLNNSKIESKYFYNHFNLDAIHSIIFYDLNIEQFIKEKKNYINEFYTEASDLRAITQLIDDNAKTFAYDSEEIFGNLVEKYKNDNKEFNKYILNTCLFFHINKLYTLDDFFLRNIFEKIFEEYSKKICDDLITGEGKPKKKRKKKKKNNKDDNKIDTNNKDSNKNLEIDNKIFHDEQKDEKNNKDINNTKDVKEINNNQEIIIKKKEIDNVQSMNNDTKNIINSETSNEINKISEKESIKDENNINKIIQENNSIYEKTNNFNSKKAKNNKKEKGFFLYEAIKKDKKEKKKANNKTNKKDNNKTNNANINENNISTTINKETEDNIKESNIVNNIDSINNIKYDNESLDKIENKNIIINNDNTKEYKEDLKKVNIISISKNISIQSHINSFTLSSSNNSSTSSDSNNYKNNNVKNNEQLENNLFVVHQNPMIISYEVFNKLLDDINIFNKDLESLLIIIRKIKLEIRYHFEEIVKKLYNQNSKVEIYGSSLYQLDIESSDLDLSISTKSKLPLNSLVTYLLNNNCNNQYLDINPIYTASIPIIKLDLDFLKLNNYKINDLYQLLINNEYYKMCINNNFYNNFNIIKVDISMNSINYKQMHFIKKGNNHFPQIKPLIKILKKLLILKNMNNSYKGGMSSYCLFLIIYSYLRMNKSFNNLDYNYGSLLIGFLFHYVMCIDFKYTIINPSLNNPFIISNIPIETVPTIIEPTTMKNAGKNIYKILDVVNALKEIYRDFFIIIKEDKSDDNLIYKLFRKYIESDK